MCALSFVLVHVCTNVACIVHKHSLHTHNKRSTNHCVITAYDVSSHGFQSVTAEQIPPRVRLKSHIEELAQEERWLAGLYLSVRTFHTLPVSSSLVCPLSFLCALLTFTFTSQRKAGRLYDCLLNAIGFHNWRAVDTCHTSTPD